MIGNLTIVLEIAVVLTLFVAAVSSVRRNLVPIRPQYLDRRPGKADGAN